MDSSSKISVDCDTTLKDALLAMDRGGIGLLLLNGGNKFRRTISDGDLRRLILKGHAMDAALSVLPDIKSITAPGDI